MSKTVPASRSYTSTSNATPVPHSFVYNGEFVNSQIAGSDLFKGEKKYNANVSVNMSCLIRQPKDDDDKKDDTDNGTVNDDDLVRVKAVRGTKSRVMKTNAALQGNMKSITKK